MADDDYEEDDRGPLEEPPKKISSNIISGIVIFLLLAVCLGLLSYMWMGNKDSLVEKPKKKTQIIESVPEFEIPVEKVEPRPLVIAEIKDEILPVVVPVRAESTPFVIEKHVDSDLDRKLQSGLNNKESKENISANSPLNIASQQNSENPNIDFSVTKTPIMKAGLLPSTRWILPKGTPISCVLDTAIQSDQPGLIKCSLTEDVYSTDKTIKLLDRGSIATGEYRVSSISYGKSRIFAIWDRIRTPAGAVIDVASPATDSLGRAGIGGFIDRHYFERFGTAILISIIDDVFDNSVETEYYNKSSNSISESFGEILKEYAKIKPTLHKNQGGEVLIFTARDLDFSSIYGLANVEQ
jgi:type IV secretion system protein VirB10